MKGSENCYACTHPVVFETDEDGSYVTYRPVGCQADLLGAVKATLHVATYMPGTHGETVAVPATTIARLKEAYRKAGG